MTLNGASPPQCPVRVGISSCLLGEAVRYDGGHKRDAFLTDTFGRFVEWVPVCPEVECGLGTPRESMGGHFTVTFNGQTAIEWDDETFKDAGKLGVWTKADSVTEFDDFTYGAK